MPTCVAVSASGYHMLSEECVVVCVVRSAYCLSAEYRNVDLGPTDPVGGVQGERETLGLVAQHPWARLRASPPPVPK